MRESTQTFHNLEWPPEGARLAGPVAWLRGWVVGKPGHDCVDLRVRHQGRTHLGVLGLPRIDLARHFGSTRSWLPAEFILGVPLLDGAVSLALEVMDANGCWHELQTIDLIIAPDGTPPPRVEGRLENQSAGTWTVRDAHHPFHGHLDDPGPRPVLSHGHATVFGWLLDETRDLSDVLATTDTLVFNHLEHSRTDESLAAKVPQYPAARRARLRGQVDCPATLIYPVCLRVYAVSADGSIHLCFAQRICPAPAEPRSESTVIDYPAIPARSLPALSSGRPHRLLMVIRSLLPNDATLRALDLARYLIPTHRWAARVVSSEDGLLRTDFEQSGVESLVVNPDPLFAACDGNVMQRALDELQRAIRWDHLDAVAVFDPVCGWAITLARRRKIPVLFDCVSDEPMATDATAIAEVRAFLEASWRTATGVCFASLAAARAQIGQLAGRPAAIIPHWHSPNLPAPAGSDGPRIAFAPLRTIDWLKRQHPDVATRWNFRQGPAGNTAAEDLARLDDRDQTPSMQRPTGWTIDQLSLCLGPLFGRGPLRPLLDAAAGGVPLVAPDLPTTRELFAHTRIQLVAEDNPLALAHALLACDANPDAFLREAAALVPVIRARHDPARLLPEWERLLASVAAAGPKTS